jgi:ABC-type antimicrobial peptide transport system permease subunit
MVVYEGLVLSMVGLVVGLVGALWVAQAGSSLLFGISPNDPLTFTTVSLSLIAVAAAACYFPARRAMRINPLVALRCE